MHFYIAIALMILTFAIPATAVYVATRVGAAKIKARHEEHAAENLAGQADAV